MKKIPTLFARDPENRRYVTDKVTPGCEWVLAGEGVATRKYDGTCMARLEGAGWVARREVKPGKTPPPNFVPLGTDETTGKTVGWEPVEQSPFVKFWREAVEGGHADFEYGTYELAGPKINGNPEGYVGHRMVRHDDAVQVLFGGAWTYESCRELVTDPAWTYEGIVWHHPDGRMAKLKVRDFPVSTRAGA